MKYVVDCCVALKWFLPENLTDQAERLLAAFRMKRIDLCAPDVLLAEFGGVLLRRQRRGEFSQKIAEEVWSTFLDLRISMVDIQSIAPAAMALVAYTQAGQFMDALYVALAKSLDCSVITADEHMVNAFRAIGCVTSLADVQVDD